jgi:tRNA threonylcarbamoyl adenosine modification protein YeaZ
MRILGIDTATNSAGVAIIDDEAVIDEKRWDKRQLANGAGKHSLGNCAEIVVPLIDSLLDKKQLTPTNLSAIAVSIGPGSFTGLRVGLAIAKGIAYSGGLPLIGISTLLAIAATVKNFQGIVCALLDARKNDVYIGLFRRDGEVLSRLTDDTLVSIDAAIELVRHYRGFTGNGLWMAITGDAVELHKEKLCSAFQEKLLLSSGDAYGSVAAEVALLARERLLNESPDDLGSLVPVYLRRPDAEVRKLNVTR